MCRHPGCATRVPGNWNWPTCVELAVTINLIETMDHVGLASAERLRKLALEHSPKVASYLNRRAYPLSEADLEDLLEEVLVVTWRRIDDVPEGFELPWMIGVA